MESIGDPTGGKITVVDGDIDIGDPFALNWVITFRVQPDRDV